MKIASLSSIPLKPKSSQAKVQTKTCTNFPIHYREEKKLIDESEQNNISRQSRFTPSEKSCYGITVFYSLNVIQNG